MPHKPITRCLLTWFADNARDLPWRRTRDPYAIWVSEVMLQQTQVKTVIPYWERWMRQLPNIRALAKTNSNKLHKLWEGLGYYTRVRNMQKAARAIIKDYGGRFPKQFEDILALPGIGRYTAGAICSIAFNQPYPVVDGNVTRVLTRLFGIEGNPRECSISAQLWRLAEELVRNAVEIPARLARLNSNSGRKAPATGKADRSPVKKVEWSPVSNLNQALMELGAVICTARQPKCELCPVASFCVAVKENRIQELPTRSSPPRTTKRRVAAFILEHKGRFLVRQRSGGIVNAHLWEFPNIELISEDYDLQKAAKKELQVRPVLGPFCTIKHSITRFRITVEVYRAAVPNGVVPPPPAGSRWLTQGALQRLPFASAHKKILVKLQAQAPAPT